MERIEGLVAEGQAITGAMRFGNTQSDQGVKQVNREYEEWKAALARDPVVPRGMPPLTDAERHAVARIIASGFGDRPMPSEVS